MNTFCPLLFQHLATHPYGGVTHCCIADHQNQASNAYDVIDGKKRIYNVNHDDLISLYNSESFRKARLQSLDGEIPHACRKCFETEERGFHSKRLEEQKNYPDFTIDRAREITDETGRIEDPQFEFVELRLGNTCNVQCRTCNPASSSKWKRDHAALEKQFDFVTSYGDLGGFRWPEREEFWNQLYDRTRDVKTFYINGGEPMLIKQHLKFLRRLLDDNRTDVTLWYNINMTLMSEDVIDLWKNFSRVKVSASIDDLGERNYYIRYPSDWNTVIQNLDRLQKEDWIDLDVTQTVSFMNYCKLGDFYQYMNNRGLFVHHNLVTDPSFLSPSVLPREIVKKASINKMPVHLQEQLAEWAGQEQDQIGWIRAKKYTRAVDQQRGQNITHYLDEFKEYFEE